MSDRPMLETKGFVRSLYDFQFTSLVTMRFVKVLYAILTIIYSIAAVIWFIILLARHSALSIVAAIIGVPIVYFLYLIFARIAMEILMVIFGIGEDVRHMRYAGAGAIAPGGAPYYGPPGSITPPGSTAAPWGVPGSPGTPPSVPPFGAPGSTPPSQGPPPPPPTTP